MCVYHNSHLVAVFVMLLGLLFISMVEGTSNIDARIASNIEAHIKTMVEKHLITEAYAESYKETLHDIVVKYEGIRIELETEYEKLSELEDEFTTRRSTVEFTTWLQDKDEPMKYLTPALKKRVRDFIKSLDPLPSDAAEKIESIQYGPKLPGGPRCIGFNCDSNLCSKKCFQGSRQTQREALFGILLTLYEPQLFANIYGYIVNDPEKSYCLVGEKYHGDIGDFFQPQNNIEPDEMYTETYQMRLMEFMEKVGKSLQRLYITHGDIWTPQIFYISSGTEIEFRLGDFGWATFYGLNYSDFDKAWPGVCKASGRICTKKMYVNPYLWKSKLYPMSAATFFDGTRMSHRTDQYALGITIYDSYCLNKKIEEPQHKKDYNLRSPSISEQNTNYFFMYDVISQYKKIYDECMEQDYFSNEQKVYMDEHVISVWKSFLEKTRKDVWVEYTILYNKKTLKPETTLRELEDKYKLLDLEEKMKDIHSIDDKEQNIHLQNKENINQDIVNFEISEFESEKYPEFDGNESRSNWIWSLIIILCIAFIVLFAEIIHKQQYFCDQRVEIEEEKPQIFQKENDEEEGKVEYTKESDEEEEEKVENNKEREKEEGELQKETYDEEEGGIHTI